MSDLSTSLNRLLDDGAVFSNLQLFQSNHQYTEGEFAQYSPFIFAGSTEALDGKLIPKSNLEREFTIPSFRV